MFLGLGIQELVIILIIALLIFGPKNLPKLGSTMGKTVKNLREGMEDDANKDDSKAAEAPALEEADEVVELAAAPEPELAEAPKPAKRSTAKKSGTKRVATKSGDAKKPAKKSTKKSTKETADKKSTKSSKKSAKKSGK